MANTCNAPAVPVLTKIADRRHSIVANTPAIFIVDANPEAREYPFPIYAVTNFEEVTVNTATITQIAQRYGVSADFIKAIVWMESTHGWYDRFSPRNETIRPMNVHDTLWAQLGIDRKTLLDRKLNIAAGVHILAALWDRVQNPTVEKVATLYNQLGATKVNGYGKTVQYYLNRRPWTRLPGPGPNTFRMPCVACHRRD